MPAEQHTPKSFQEAYHILQTNATKLENTQDIDIDNLIDTVEQSITAYKVCQARIHAVEQALGDAFSRE